jgi:hypothetical protein
VLNVNKIPKFQPRHEEKAPKRKQTLSDVEKNFHRW